MTSLTLRHATMAASAAASAALAALLTVPAAADQLATADRTRAQATTLHELVTNPKTGKSLTSARTTLPATVTAERATSALAVLAQRQNLTWSTITASSPTTRVVPTSVADVTLSTITVEATVNGPRQDVAALLAAVARAKPLMTVQSLTLDGDRDATAHLRVAVHAAAPAPSEEPR